MGFFGAQQIASAKGSESNDALYRRLECKACPLDQIKENMHPHMEPTGSDKPLVYMLGQWPTKYEDESDDHFLGKSGKIVRDQIPREYKDKLRWNNVVRTKPSGGDLSDAKIAVECCRPSVERDIIASRPKAIFGFGNYPLNWVSGQNGIAKWRGRRMPVRIGDFTTWYFSFSHPLDLLRMRKKSKKTGEEYPSEIEKVFTFDMERAFSVFEELPAPRVWTAQEALGAVELIDCSPSGLARLEELLNWAGKQPSVGLDYETFPIRPYAHDAALLSAAIGTEKRSFSFAFDHPEAKWTKAQKERVRELWKRFLKSKTTKCVHNLKFEHEWTAVQFGQEYLRASQWEDSYNQAAVLDERFGDMRPGCLSLEFLVQQYFGFNLKKLSNVNRKDLRKESLRDVLAYNGPDAKFHHLLFLAQKEELRIEKLQKVYELDRRKIPALVLTQVKGVEVYGPANKELTEKYQGRVDDALKEISVLPELSKYKEKFGKEFNPTSGPQLIQMLEQIMKRKDGRREVHEGEQDKYDVDEEVLSKIDHPLTKAVLKLRKANKVVSTYLVPYTADPDKGCLWPDGKVHTILNQPGTVSDRTSSEDPNIQNIPKRDAESKEVRRQFRARKGRVKLACDYGQIQFRGIAMASRDTALVEYLWADHDVHMDWAHEFAHAWPDVIGGKKNLTDKATMKNLRRIVKNKWVFPSVFGAHVMSRADYMRGDTKCDIPDRVVQEIDRRFWKQFSGIAAWHAEMEKYYRKYGFVYGLSGRFFRGPLSKNQFINYPIQEVEAQIVVGHAMCEVSERAEREGDPNLQPELEIHDDLTFDLPADEVDEYVPKIVTDMLSVPYDYINVPLTVEVSVGKDIYNMEPVLVASSATWGK